MMFDFWFFVFLLFSSSIKIRNSISYKIETQEFIASLRAVNANSNEKQSLIINNTRKLHPMHVLFYNIKKTLNTLKAWQTPL